jgi:opacity protein-like surface antigen
VVRGGTVRGALAFALLALACVTAEPEDPPIREGRYLAVGGIYAKDDFDVPDGVSIDDGYGGTLRVGYRFDERVASELVLEYLQGFDASAAGVDVGDFDGWSLTANGKFYLSETYFRPYGMVGIGALKAEFEDSIGLDVSADETDLVTRFAIGAEHHDPRNFWLGLEASYHLPFGDLEDFAFYALTLTVGFGL